MHFYGTRRTRIHVSPFQVVFSIILYSALLVTGMHCIVTSLYYFCLLSILLTFSTIRSSALSNEPCPPCNSNALCMHFSCNQFNTVQYALYLHRMRTLSTPPSRFQQIFRSKFALATLSTLFLFLSLWHTKI